MNKFKLKNRSSTVPQTSWPFRLDNRGFTIVEIIMVTAIIGILAALAIPAYDNIKDRVRVARATEEIRGMERAIIAWGADRGGVIPANKAELVSITGVDKDPWGNPYQYFVKGTAPSHFGIAGDPDGVFNTDYDLYSMGKDGDTDPDITNIKAQDDVIRVNDGGWVGVEYLLTAGML